MAKNGLQRNLFVYSMEFENSPLIKRYRILFSQIDLNFIKPFNTGKGAIWYSRHALIRALIYQKLYKKRQSVERYFARLQALRVEIPLFFNQTSIANATTIAHLALSAVALTAVALDRPHKIRSYRTFAH